MRSLGLERVAREDDGLAWGVPDGSGRMQWLIVTPAVPELRDVAHTYGAPGFHHVAFNVESRAAGDRAHAVLVAGDAEIIEAPSEYDDDPDAAARTALAA